MPKDNRTKWWAKIWWANLAISVLFVIIASSAIIEFPDQNHTFQYACVVLGVTGIIQAVFVLARKPAPPTDPKGRT